MDRCTYDNFHSDAFMVCCMISFLVDATTASMHAQKKRFFFFFIFPFKKVTEVGKSVRNH